MNAIKEHIRADARALTRYLLLFLKWTVLSVITGLVVGLIGVAFHTAVDWATVTRTAHPALLYALPVAGLLIVCLYHVADMDHDRGTNLVLYAVRGDEPVTIRMAPLIFITSTLTHLCGGSAGREGAALQLGGSVASCAGRHLGFRGESRRILVACGMAAGFSALFGTPIAAAVFALEVSQVGIMHYAALVPACISSLTAAMLARSVFRLAPTAYTVAAFPALSPLTLIQTTLLAICTAVVAILFVRVMHVCSELYQKHIPNPYLRAAAGGVIVILLTLLVGTRDYNGAGAPVIAAAMAGDARPTAFLMKILFTALTLGAGYKGGEIVPVLFTGATFGCVAGPLLGLPASFSASVGMVALFCGVTNCPVTSLFLALELFGGKGIGLYAAACAVSYMLSGYGGLYSAQEIVYPKTEQSPDKQ